jgi:hypothetical protein
MIKNIKRRKKDNKRERERLEIAPSFFLFEACR